MMAKEFDIEQVRKDFPILDQQVNGAPLVYFDNAATTQKPQVVIDALEGDIENGQHYFTLP